MEKIEGSMPLQPALISATPYQFEGHNFTIVEIDGEPWFAATDVSRELGYHNTNDLTRVLDEDEKGAHIVRTLGGDQKISVISEPGLYRAILQRRSNKKHDQKLVTQIERFQRWVFHDVLPTIRSTGSYQPVLAMVDPMKILSDPVAMRGLLLTYSEKVITLEAEKAELLPKVETLARIEGADGSMCITDAAKTLSVRPKDLFAFMSAHHWIYKRVGNGVWLARQEKIQAGVMEHDDHIYQDSSGHDRVVTRALVTAKGLVKLAELLNKPLH